MGKKAKEHRKKVAKRNRILAQERRRYEKMTEAMINRMYESKNSGLDITSNINLPKLDGPLMIPPTEQISTTPTPTILNGPLI